MTLRGLWRCTIFCWRRVSEFARRQMRKFSFDSRHSPTCKRLTSVQLQCNLIRIKLRGCCRNHKKVQQWLMMTHGQKRGRRWMDSDVSAMIVLFWERLFWNYCVARQLLDGLWQRSDEHLLWIVRRQFLTSRRFPKRSGGWSHIPHIIVTTWWQCTCCSIGETLCAGKSYSYLHIVLTI